MTRAASIAALSVAAPVPAHSAALPADATYDGTDVAGIEDIVAGVQRSEEPWRVEAEKRIDRHRKANATVKVIDARGRPAEGAEVHIVLRRHEFRFGCAISVRAFSGQTKGIAPKVYRELLPKFANYAGFNNALKYKLRGGLEDLVPPIMWWLAERRIPVRGHTLIWPGWSHMHRDALRLKADMHRLRDFCRKQIVDCARKWDLVEWDVINESRDNHHVQDILGREIMVEWFKLAAANVRNQKARLVLNENRVISAPPRQERNLERYLDEVKFLVERGAPVSGLGFQSRFKFDCPPEKIYRRLRMFEDLELAIAATEFEITDTGKRRWTEEACAAMPQRVMAVCFSRPLVSSTVVWTFMEQPGEEDRSALVTSNGRPKLNGKMWLYLTRGRWHTDERATTDRKGRASSRGYKGDYVITVTHLGAERTRPLRLVRAVRRWS
ncbi:MAG: endo-1,4-beta-xylanase [Planctomycetota bacterium]|jgi:hypothetical protein